MKARYSVKGISGIIFLLFFIPIIQGCNPDIELHPVRNISITGKLKYRDLKSGTEKDLPKPADFNVFLEGSNFTVFAGKSYGGGIWSYSPLVEKRHTVEFSMKDTILQFQSKLVKKEDLDTIRSDEFLILEYKATSSFDVKDEVQKIDALLLSEGTGLQLTVKDENGQPIRGASLCLYSNETFYSSNFPNCGGSLKYLETDNNGTVLFLGLSPNTGYFINCKAKIGILDINNHYDAAAQKFNTGNSGQILSADLIIK